MFVEDFVDSRNGALTKDAEFVQLTVMWMPPDFFGMITTGLAHGDVECWMRPVARTLSASTGLAFGGLMW